MGSIKNRFYPFSKKLIVIILIIYRHRDVSRETKLRQAAEERLDKLVDMYGDPAVNQELKSRLPYASSNSDVRVHWQQELDELIQAELEKQNQQNRPPKM